MIKKLSSLFFLLSITTQVSALELKKFVTDNCTMFVEGTMSEPNAWKHCCVDHDLRYWLGGQKEESLKADMRLKKCVTDSGHPNYARLMFSAIRLGRYSPIKNKYKWGWGWNHEQGYTPFSREEILVINKNLDELNFDPLYLADFKRFYNLVLKTKE